MDKVLIIKTGADETFASSPVRSISLGDVLRSTVLLSLFKTSRVTWLTSRKAAPLLTPNSDLQVICEEDLDSNPMGYDTVVNLEKSERWTEHLRKKPAERNYGFIDFDGRWICNSDFIHSPLNLQKIGSWQEGLYALLGRQWKGEEYQYKNPSLSSLPVKNDVGLNWMSGAKWPNKMWKKERWQELSHALGEQGYSVSWQEGFDSIHDYAKWIASCRSIITIDSLGLHLSLALKKRTLALFGPTSPKEVCFYDHGFYLAPRSEDFSCAPCFNPECVRKITCMEMISVNNALKAFRELYEGINLNGVGKEQNFSSKRI